MNSPVKDTGGFNITSAMKRIICKFTKHLQFAYTTSLQKAIEYYTYNCLTSKYNHLRVQF